jgi:hypothetical protein
MAYYGVHSERYRGFEIRRQYTSSNSIKFTIHKDGEIFSYIVLTTIKATKRVIDTYLKSIN